MSTLTEPVVLLSGVLGFTILAHAATGGASSQLLPHKQLQPLGPILAAATLSHGKVARTSDGEVFVHVRLGGRESPGELPIELALVLDVSEKAGRAELASKAVLAVSRQLRRDDRIAVVAFAEQARLVLGLDGTRGELAPGMESNLHAGLVLAARELRSKGRPNAIKRMLIVTAGKPTVGEVDPTGLRDLARHFADGGISISSLGLGLAFDAPTLAAMAEAGGGRYHQVDDASRVEAIYDSELRSLRELVARSVRLTLVPEPGVSILDVPGWDASRDREGVHVTLGDFDRQRSSKVVARLRVPPTSNAAAPVVRVAIDARDAHTGVSWSTPLALGVRFVASEAEARTSFASEIRKDLEDVHVAQHLALAREFARRGDSSRVASSLAEVKRFRSFIEFEAADGKVERRSIGEIEQDLGVSMTAVGSTGDRYFDTNQAGVIFYTSGSQLTLDTSTCSLPNNGVIATGSDEHRTLARNESSAIGALKTIATSEAIFREGDKEQDGNLDYGMLDELAKTNLIDSVLGGGVKQGYTFTVKPATNNSEFLWFATASPTNPGVTGERYFYTNQAGVIYYSTTPFQVDPKTGEPIKGNYERGDKFIQSALIPIGK